MSHPIRKPLRLRQHDYRHGAYFVTSCLWIREPRFGEIVEHGLLRPTDAGEMISHLWRAMPNRFPGLVLDDFIVMPDHMHAIAVLTDSAETGVSLGDVMQQFKSLSSRLDGEGVREGIYAPFERRLWQPRFHDHIIRDGEDLDRHRRYIHENPLRWWLHQQAERASAHERDGEDNTR